MKSEKLEDKKWTILKIFKRLVNTNSSVFDRQFLFNSLWITKKIIEIGNSDYCRIIFKSEDIEYIKEIIGNDEVLTNKEKNKIKSNFDKFKDLNSSKWKKVGLYSLQEEIKKLDFPTNENYYFRVEKALFESIEKYLSSLHKGKNFYLIKKVIELYISTRIDLGYSINLISDFLKREEKYLKQPSKNKEKVFLENFKDKFKSKNISRKEKYSIYVPLTVSKKYFNEVKKLDFSENIKIVRYSYPEGKMSNPISLHTKNFDKDKLYLAFEKLQSLDWQTLTNKIIWEKAMNFTAIFKLNSVDLELDFKKPSIVLKILKNGKTKIEEFWSNLNFLKETDSLFPVKISQSLVEQLEKGDFKERTSKFKSFLRSKSEFETSINPIERINLSARSLELYSKYPFKKGYGGKKWFDAIKEISIKSKSKLLVNHTVNLVLRNYSDILYNLKLEKHSKNNEKNSSTKSRFIKQVVLKKILSFNDFNKQNYEFSPWIRNVFSEIQGTKKLPKNVQKSFCSFLYMSSIFVVTERNKQIHNKAIYNLKDILLSEIVDAMLSSSTQIDSQKEYVKRYEKN